MLEVVDHTGSKTAILHLAERLHPSVATPGRHASGFSEPAPYGLQADLERLHGIRQHSADRKRVHTQERGRSRGARLASVHGGIRSGVRGTGAGIRRMSAGKYDCLRFYLVACAGTEHLLKGQAQHQSSVYAVVLQAAARLRPRARRSDDRSSAPANAAAPRPVHLCRDELRGILQSRERTPLPCRARTRVRAEIDVNLDG